MASREGSPDAKLLIVHADDAGMCHSANAATTRALTGGIVSSTSVMVPCPWFPEMAAWAVEHPDADVGVHLTLTSEWRYYRWRPVAPLAEVKGLLDDEGFMWRGTTELSAHAAPEEIEVELRAQIERALLFGIKPTHVDSHMGALFYDPRYLEVYVRVSREFGIMPMLADAPADLVALGEALGFDYPAYMQQLRREGYLFLDRLITNAGGDTYDERRANICKIIKTLQPGVTELIVHLNEDDPEAHHIAYSSHKRYDELRVCTDPEVKALLEAEGVKLIGYRDLAALRS